ncbi:hypothetical protein E2562_024679 [Oryza meyeriana var. granulata]|uniref:Uncharacterized protein n=1 Tax=Oryza meyeriana var. granulata TaxID=110450 RepID=A0A6G1EBD9_9ORYZ|nr:hypothetical protein E2562_024679 [Oryza meyeriana var. granulata]KAF0922108.1 hypothetical protein E2562_024679 [Oryza meyeriana var. granulata]
MESGTNARRRRLVERGSDRLAFITGQAHSLPSDPPPDSPLSTVDATAPQISEWQASEGGISGDKFSNKTQLQKSEPSGVVPDSQLSAKARQEILDDDLLQGLKTNSTVPEIQPVNETPLRRHSEETLSKKINHDRTSVPRREMEMRPRSVPPNQSNLAENAAWSVKTLKEHLNFTPNEITQAVSATEYNRFLASIIVAFLVVLSNWGLDIGGIITRVLVGTRPLLFLIITNITIVFTLLMENKDPDVRGRSAGSNLGSADSLGQMLEIGLLLQKSLSALLMDCSVCAVILICFL